MGVALETIASFFTETHEALAMLKKAYCTSDPVIGPCIVTNSREDEGRVPIAAFLARHRTAYMNRVAHKTPHSMEILRRELEPSAPTVPLFGGVPPPPDSLSDIESRHDRFSFPRAYHGKWE
jgi:hypothetical protein